VGRTRKAKAALAEIEETKKKLAKAEAEIGPAQKRVDDAEAEYTAAGKELALLENSATKKRYKQAGKARAVAIEAEHLARCRVAALGDKVASLEVERKESRAREIPGEIEQCEAEYQAIAEAAYKMLEALADSHVELFRLTNLNGRLRSEADALRATGHKVAQVKRRRLAFNGEVPHGPAEAFLAKWMSELIGGYSQGFQVRGPGFWRAFVSGRQ